MVLWWAGLALSFVDLAALMLPINFCKLFTASCCSAFRSSWVLIFRFISIAWVFISLAWEVVNCPPLGDLPLNKTLASFFANLIQASIPQEESRGNDTVFADGAFFRSLAF